MQTQRCETGTEQNPSSVFRESELREMLAEAIEALPKTERLVVSLYYYDELTLKEIESVLGISADCIVQLKTGAMLKLQPLCKLLQDINAQRL